MTLKFSFVLQAHISLSENVGAVIQRGRSLQNWAKKMVLSGLSFRIFFVEASHGIVESSSAIYLALSVDPTGFPIPYSRIIMTVQGAADCGFQLLCGTCSL